MSQSSKQEILRSPLEQVVLKTKLLDMGPPYRILTLTIDPPKLTDILKAIQVLKDLGGLHRTCDGNRRRPVVYRPCYI